MKHETTIFKTCQHIHLTFTKPASKVMTRLNEHCIQYISPLGDRYRSAQPGTISRMKVHGKAQRPDNFAQMPYKLASTSHLAPITGLTKIPCAFPHRI